jgi:hypothetical protein
MIKNLKNHQKPFRFPMKKNMYYFEGEIFKKAVQR